MTREEQLLPVVIGLADRIDGLEQFLILGLAGSVRSGAATSDQIGVIFDMVVAGLHGAHHEGPRGAESMTDVRRAGVIAYVEQLRRLVESSCKAQTRQ